ncbi:MAG: PAS domain S-box protein, partial [Acidobacteriota bacterium]
MQKDNALQGVKEENKELKREIKKLRSELKNSGPGKDIFKDQNTAEKIRRSEENYKNIFNITNDAIFIYDKKTRSIIDVNLAAEKIYKYSKEELKTMKAGALSSGKKKYTEKTATKLFNKAINDGPQKFLWKAKRKGGAIFWVEVELRNVVFNGTETVMSIVKDINEQKTAESQRLDALLSLKESEERYKTLVENIGEGIIVHSNFKVIYLNRASMEIVGNGEPEEYFIGKNVAQFVHPDSHSAMRQRIKQVYDKKSNVGILEEKFIRTDGKVINVEVIASMINFNGEPASLVVFKDISERKAAEKKLEESEESYRELFNKAIDSIYIQDMNGVFIDVNQGAVDKYGYPKEFFIGKTPEILSAPGMNDMDMVVECIQNALKGKPQQFEFWGIKKNGDIFPKIVRVSKGKFFGKDVIIAFSIDISERKKNEEEKKILELQIQHSQKLESLGILAGGIAHDFNNLLTGILGNAGMARLDAQPGDPVLGSIKNIETTAIRAADLCNQLLAYSGKGRSLVLPINLNSVIREMTTLLKASLPKKVEIEYKLSHELAVIEVDVSQIRQIIMNLILNASDSIGKKQGKIVIRTGISKKLSERKGSTMFLTENLRSNSFVYFEVADNGTGIEKAMIDRIFDPFFTTKSSGKGLGLSAVIGIVKSHRGLISIKSRKNAGTDFRICFPESSKTPVDDGFEYKPAKEWEGKGTILIADDERSIRTLCSNILTKSGFNVISAINGDDAVKKFTENSNEIALVLIDMTMPGKNGIEVMREISAIRPGIKAILSSGYTKSEAIKNFSRIGFREFLPKPYSPEKLIELVKKIIESP